MTIKELIQELEEFPEDWQIIMAKDGEGNSYTPAYCVSEEEYIPENEYSGELNSAQDAIENNLPWKPNCIVFWPTN